MTSYLALVEYTRPGFGFNRIYTRVCHTPEAASEWAARILDKYGNRDVVVSVSQVLYARAA